MPAPAAAAIAPKLMIEGGKDPITSLPIIVQPLDKHFLLCGELVVARSRLGRDRHRTALAIGDVPRLTRKRLMTFRAIFFFVFFHQAIGSFTVFLSFI
jgi:hypothetical protein